MTTDTDTKITDKDMQKLFNCFEYLLGQKLYWELCKGDILVTCCSPTEELWEYRGSHKECMLFVNDRIKEYVQGK